MSIIAAPIRERYEMNARQYVSHCLVFFTLVVGIVIAVNVIGQNHSLLWRLIVLAIGIRAAFGVTKVLGIDVFFGSKKNGNTTHAIQQLKGLAEKRTEGVMGQEEHERERKRIIDQI